MNYPRYPEYKPSGVEWLGKVPGHWEVKRLKWTIVGCFNGIWGDEADAGDDDILCVRVADFDREGFRVELTEPTIRSVTSRERRNRLLQQGDLLLEKSGGGELQPVGAVVQYQLDNPAVCSNFVARLAVHEDHDSRFLAYFHSHLYQGRVNFRSIKQTTGIQNLDSDAYLSELIGLPPAKEQRAIAAFLDCETARIDALIEKKRRFIELLQEKRAALISRAVTHGLDPNVPLKDSGVEWLGQIPAHWDVMPLKRELSFVTSGSRGWAGHYSDEGKTFIRIGNLTRDSIMLDLSDIQYVDVPDGTEGERTRIKDGDLLISITAYLGSVAVAPEKLGEAYVSQHVALARPTQNRAIPRWLGYVLLSFVGKAQLEMQGYGGTKVQLGLDDIRSLLVLIPKKNEQKKIVDYLDCEVAKVDGLRTKVESAIEKLKEYRTALIAAAVTGKIDVWAS